MNFITRMADTLARYSVSRWNRCRLTRVLCRAGYRLLGELYILQHPNSFYPWPYSAIARWEEADDTLVSDPSGFVIRRSTSYCAWKIRQLTGKWPKHVRGVRYDAKDWGKFLKMNGFSRVLNAASRVGLYNHAYIGVAAEEGQYGQLYWLEVRLGEKLDEASGQCLLCSTFEDFRLTLKQIDARRSDVAWYELDCGMNKA